MLDKEVYNMLEDQIRRYVRVEVTKEDPIHVKISRIGTRQMIKEIPSIGVETVNLSAQGIKIRSPYRFKEGILVELAMTIEGKQIQATGKILREIVSGEQYDYAISFTIMNEYNKGIIMNYVKRQTIHHIKSLRGQ